jgi:hypothetical protein
LETKAPVCPAITKFLGWWISIPTYERDQPNPRIIGQIVEVNDMWSVVRCDDGDDHVASTAILDSRICKLYPSRRAAMRAAQ